MNENAARVYSPTQTMAWDFCPMARKLRKTGWSPRRIGKPTLGGILGTAIGIGLNAHNYVRFQSDQGWGVPAHADACATLAVSHATEALAAFELAGHYVGDWDIAQRDAITGRVEKAVRKYIEDEPIPWEWDIRHIEYTLPSRSRIDLGLVDSEGPAVLDYKVKLRLEDKYRQKEIAAYKDSWQMRHYCWEYAQVIGEPIYRYYICLIVLEPRFHIELIPFVLDPEELETWERSARIAWSHMQAEDEGREAVRMATKHSDNFGPCEFYDACLRFRLEEPLMEHDYAKREERK